MTVIQELGKFTATYGSLLCGTVFRLDPEDQNLFLKGDAKDVSLRNGHCSDPERSDRLVYPVSGAFVEGYMENKK